MPDNPYRNQPMYSRDVCQLMRDINGLEAAVSAGSVTEVMSATDGTYIYVMADRGRAIKVFSCADGSYSTSWNLPAFDYDDQTNIGINYDAPNLYVTRTRARAEHATTAIQLSTAGVVADTTAIPVWSAAALADGDGIYCVGFTEADEPDVFETQHIYKFSWPGGQLWRTKPSDQGYAIGLFAGVNGRPRLRLIGNLFAYVSGRWGYRYGFGVGEFDESDGTFTVPRLESDTTAGHINFRHFVVTSNGYLLDSGVETFKLYYFDVGFNYDSVTTDALPSSGTQPYVSLCADYAGGFVYVLGGQPGAYRFYKIDSSDWSTDVDDASLSLSWGDETHWYAYSYSTKQSLGAPDSGVTVPDLEGLTTVENAGTILAARHLTDMRNAIEAVAPYYENGVTTNAFNWTDDSADNLYYVAMGDRTDYGATGGARYDWTHSASELVGNPCYDIDIGEIYECVEKLKASDPV